MVKQVQGLAVTTAMDHMAKNNGFTLIELLLVILILGTLSTLGLQSYADFQARKRVDAETHIVTGYLNLAYDKTASSDKTSSCDTYSGSYTVSLVGSVMSLTPDGCPALSTYTFEDGFTFPEGDFSTTFLPLGRGTSGDACILVKHPTAERCGKITIESSGIVSSDIVTLASCVCP